MEMLIPGLCGLVVIIGLVAIVMSRANWSIPQMILVAFTLLGSVVFFYFAARTLVLAKNWNDEIKTYTTKIAETEHGKLQGNQIVEPGIEQLRQDRDRLKHEVEVALADRGRAWHLASIQQTNSDTGEIIATVDDPTPHGIEAKSTLFVFTTKGDFSPNANPHDGKYLGEFTVTSAPDGQKTIKMIPSFPLKQLEQGELTAIGRSQGALDLYEIMPADSHTLFAQLENRDDMLKKAFSSDVLPEYMNDRTPATENEENDPIQKDRVYRWVKFTNAWVAEKPPSEKEGAAPPAGGVPAPGGAPTPAAPAASPPAFKPGEVALLDPKSAAEVVEKKVAEYDTNRPDKGKVYVRELRDYAQIFREAIRRRSELNGEIADMTTQTARVDTAKTEVLGDVAALQKEHDGLKTDLAKFQAEREIANAFVASLDRRNEALRADLSKTFRENIRMAAELDQLNRRLLEEINRRHPPVQSQASLAP